MISECFWGATTLEKTLKITNVLNDATRLKIYEYISRKHDVVNVQEIADNFDIHPNVARLHLTKLEDIGMVYGRMQKNPKGGRPYRIYELSDEVVQLQFPFRDYEMLAKIALETLFTIGEAGKEALYDTGKRFGKHILNDKYRHLDKNSLELDEKISIINETSEMLGLDPELEYMEGSEQLTFKIFNCPFKEIANEDETHSVCSMHRYFLEGMFKELFSDIKTVEEQSNMLNGCRACAYSVKIKS
jgi:predicted ArsR family transcriptional regulator